MRYIILIFSIFMFLGTAVPKASAQQEGIALVVNEDAITFSDLNQRLHMVIVSSGLPDNQDIRSKLLPQVVASLVEEQIKLQEARALEISISTKETDGGFATIAQQNNMSTEQFKAMVKQTGIHIATMERQIRAQIAWSKVVQKKIRPQITVTDTDIDAELSHLASSKGMSQYLLAEIFLPIEAPEEETEIRQLSARLLAEMKKGAPFSRIAQQFSKAPGAAQGGDIGWVGQSQLSSELVSALKGLAVNNISQPIRTPTGYHILFLRDKREITDETLPSREDVMNIIGTERLERKARRYLLDLKSSAFVDNRIGS